jgi:hypothetical protein
VQSILPFSENSSGEVGMDRIYFKPKEVLLSKKGKTGVKGSDNLVRFLL